MLWPLLLIFATVLGMGAVHVLWRRRFRAEQELAQRRTQALEEGHREIVEQLLSRQATLFTSMAEGFLLLDGDRRVLLANPAFNRLFEVSTDIRSRTILESLRSHELADLVETLCREGKLEARELKVPRPAERSLEVNGAVLVSPAGQQQGCILVFHDLTRLKQLEGTRKEFVANVSHELRTPLSLIKGAVETLLSGALSHPEAAPRFLQTIDRNAERLRLLIEDLLIISELESGRVVLNVQVFPAAKFVEKVIADFEPRAQARQITIKNEVPELMLRGDPARCEQVLCNLVDNAIKYGRVGGTVVIKGRPSEAGRVELGVQDDGPGIPPESVERVFERFYRVDKARSREQGGTGLGLSIVKHIVQSHEGRVWAQSVVGKGSTFFFTLPAGN